MAEASNISVKTPITSVNELLNCRRIKPIYELIQMEGAIHEPIFHYRVSFNDKGIPFMATGMGRSKKAAKHAAAKSLIDSINHLKMINSQMNTLNNSSAGVLNAQSNCNASRLNVTVNGNDNKILGNPIGWLQEMCMQRHWPMPYYETEIEFVVPHERLFSTVCTILTFSEVGKGKSKKIAKRIAAFKMWTRLRDNTSHDNRHNCTDVTCSTNQNSSS